MPKQLFIKGQSGNPKGKPKGTRHTATQISYALMEGRLEQVLETVLERAVGGDITACKMIIDKVLPCPKDRSINIALPRIDDLKGVSLAQTKILEAVSNGEVTPNEGERITSIIESRRKLIETIELEARISRLESRNES